MFESRDAADVAGEDSPCGGKEQEEKEQRRMNGDRNLLGEREASERADEPKRSHCPPEDWISTRKLKPERAQERISATGISPSSSPTLKSDDTNPEAATGCKEIDAYSTAGYDTLHMGTKTSSP